MTSVTLEKEQRAVESSEIAPVHQAIRVPVTTTRAFEVFTDQITTWWPLAEGMSYSGGHPKTIHLEARTGGRFYERSAEGRKIEIGRVLSCAAPERIVFTYRAPSYPADTEIEVTFRTDADATEVALEHRGWERLGDAGAAERNGHNEGWALILDRYGKTASPS